VTEADATVLRMMIGVPFTVEEICLSNGRIRDKIHRIQYMVHMRFKTLRVCLFP
jgi:hypothetical protein